MKLGYGIIGCGNISRFHFNGLRKIGAQIVHISDINEKAAEPYVKEFGTKFSTDYNRLLQDPDVTVVSVLTAGKFHMDICMAALAAGKDVICEKTMTDNASEAGDLVRAFTSSNNLFFTAFMKRFFPAARKAKELIPKLGRVYSAQVRSYQRWGDDFYNMNNADQFAGVITNYGGAVVKCAGSHMIDMTMFLLGRPEGVYAKIDYVPNSNFDRKATAMFEYETGMVVNFETAIHTLKKVGYERNSWDELIEITGVNGRIKLSTVMWDHPENNAALLEYYDNETEATTEYRFDIVNPFDEEIKYFHHCLEKREQGFPNVVDGFNVDVLIENMKLSSDKKAYVKIDWQGVK